MTQAKLSHAECNAIHILREMADDTTRKAVKRQIFARAKAAFAIPVDHKLLVETDVANASAGVLRNKATRESYELTPEGKWVGSVAAPMEKLWFKMPVDVLQQAIIDGLDNEQANGNTIVAQKHMPVGAVVNTRYDNIVATQDGSLWIQLDSDAYEETDTDDTSDEEEDEDLPF